MEAAFGFWKAWLAGEPVAPALGEGQEVALEHSWPWPPWLTVVMLVVLALLAFASYAGRPGDVPRGARLMMALLRLAALALILGMMYGWTLDRHRTDLPDLAIVVDNSASMAVVDEYGGSRAGDAIRQRTGRAGWDEPSRWNQALTLLLEERRGWLQGLAVRYRTKVYIVGQSVEQLSAAGDPQALEARLRALRPQQPASRLGTGMGEVLAAQRGRPTAALILLSDGITTSGSGLVEVAELARRAAVPLYTVGLGDDNPPRDLRVGDLLVDDVVFLGDVVNFDFSLQQEGFSGESVQVQLRDARTDEVLSESTVLLHQSARGQPVRLSHRTRAEGLQRFRVEVAPREAELNQDNNRLEVAIDVRNATIRVLMVQEYPSYEFRTLSQLLGRLVKRDQGEPLIDLTTVLQDADFDYADQDATAARVFPASREQLFAYDVLIFGDVNPAYLSRAVMQNVADFVIERGGGVVFLAGPRFTPHAYQATPLEDLFPVGPASASPPDPRSTLRESFSLSLTALGHETPFMQLDRTPDASARVWRDLPPLYWLLSASMLRPATRVLAVHPSMTTAAGEPAPVICMQFVGAGKVVFHATDESYRWSQHLGTDVYYARYWLQVIRYLSRSKLLSDGGTAELMTDKARYVQGEPVRVQVRFLDDRLAPPRDDGVRVLFDAASGRRREVVLDRHAVERGKFLTTVSDLDAGQYRVWMAAPPLEPHPAPHSFRVDPPSSEAARLEMNIDELSEAARRSRGRFYRFAEAGQVLSDLPPGRQVRIEPLPPQPVWNSAWLAALFVGLVTAEWILRKRAGMI